MTTFGPDLGRREPGRALGPDLGGSALAGRHQ